jgi:hypothetical protein
VSEEPARYNAGHDPITTLRLELGREKARADAFEAALRKEVRDVIVEAIKDAAKAVAENEQLKKDNVMLSAQVVGLQINAMNDPSLRSAFLKAAHKDYDDIKAEVERLKEACASSPVAMARFKELEGKTTFDEINPKEVRP